MQFKLLPLAALAASVSAQMNLTDTFLANPELSELTSYVRLFPAALQQLVSQSNITILAPSNAAFNKFLNSSSGSLVKNNNTAAIEAFLNYNVINGTHYASAINGTPTFLPTTLNNPAFTNVTGGQVVEAVTFGQNVTIFSGLLQNSTVSQAVSSTHKPSSYTKILMSDENRTSTLPVVSSTLLTPSLQFLRIFLPPLSQPASVL